MRGAIILAGGRSERLGGDKALLPFRGKKMIEHVLEAASHVCGETVISCRNKEQERRLASYGRCVVDKRTGFGPLEGICEGCSILESEYACVLACDMPFVSWRVIEFLFDCVQSHSAAIPSHPSGMFEPLCAMYRVRETLSACEKVFVKNEKRIFDMIGMLEDVIYVTTDRIRKLDPALLTFININTREDLEEYQ